MANGFTLQVGYSWSKTMGELNFLNRSMPRPNA